MLFSGDGEGKEEAGRLRNCGSRVTSYPAGSGPNFMRTMTTGGTAGTRWRVSVTVTYSGNASVSLCFPGIAIQVVSGAVPRRCRSELGIVIGASQLHSLCRSTVQHGMPAFTGKEVCAFLSCHYALPLICVE